jgi:hypothetical protein
MVTGVGVEAGENPEEFIPKEVPLNFPVCEGISTSVSCPVKTLTLMMVSVVLGGTLTTNWLGFCTVGTMPGLVDETRTVAHTFFTGQNI